MGNLVIMDKVSAKAHYNDVISISGLENGHIVALGVRNADATYTVAAPTGTTVDGMVMILDVALPYEIEKQQNDYVFTVGESLRALVPSLGDVVSIPVANITATSTLAANKVVVPDANETKPECLATLEGSEVLAFTIQKLYTKNGVSLAQLRCIRADR